MHKLTSSYDTPMTLYLTANHEPTALCAVAQGKWGTAPSSPSEHVLDLIRACTVVPQAASAELAYVSPSQLSESATLALAHLLLIAGEGQMDSNSNNKEGGSATRVQSALGACVRFLRAFPLYVDRVLVDIRMLVERNATAASQEGARTSVVALYGCAEWLIHPGLRGVWDWRHRELVGAVLHVAGGGGGGAGAVDASRNRGGMDQVSAAHQRQALARLHACAPVAWGLNAPM
jgi:hypothetical protein